MGLEFKAVSVAHIDYPLDLHGVFPVKQGPAVQRVGLPVGTPWRCSRLPRARVLRRRPSGLQPLPALCMHLCPEKSSFLPFISAGHDSNAFGPFDVASTVFPDHGLFAQCTSTARIIPMTTPGEVVRTFVPVQGILCIWLTMGFVSCSYTSNAF